MNEIVSVPQDDPSGSKKQKISPVCLFCKRRKIKCDRQSPCSSCVKFENKECVYVEYKKTRKPRQPKSANIESELDFLKSKIHSLEQSVRDTSFRSLDLAFSDSVKLDPRIKEMIEPVRGMRFKILQHATVYMDKAKRRNYGALTVKSMIAFDPAMEVVWVFITGKISDKLKRSVFGNDQDTFNGETGRCPNEAFKHNPLSLSLPLTASQTSLEDRILQMLPVKQVIFKIVDLFISRLYPFYPFLDQKTFVNAIEKLIPRVDLHERPSKIIPNSEDDYAYLGILLVVLRLTFITISVSRRGCDESNSNSFDTSPEALELRYLLKHSIDLEAIALARECLSRFDLYGYVRLPIVQLALFVRVYTIHGPEYGDNYDSGGESRIHNSLLFHMAYSLGLHREGTHSASQDPQSENLQRKIWYYLLYLDISQAMEFGDPLCSVMFPFDTKPPFLTDNNSNIDNVEVEQAVVKRFKFVAEIYEPLKAFLVVHLNFKSEIDMYEFAKQLSYLAQNVFHLEELNNQETGILLSDNYADDVTDLLRYKLQLQFGYFIVSYFHVAFNYFEGQKMEELSFYFLRSIITKILLVWLPFCCRISNSEKAYKYHGDLIFMPGVQLMIHRAILTMQSLMIRTKVTLRNSEQSPTHAEKLGVDEEYLRHLTKLKQLIALCEEVTDLMAKVIALFSSRYYYSWVTLKLHSFLAMIVRTDLFEQKVYKDRMDFPLLQDPDKLTELIDLLQQAKAKNNSSSNDDLMGQYGFVSDFTFPDLTSSTDASSEVSQSTGGLPTSVPHDSEQVTNSITDQIDSLWMSTVANQEKKKPRPDFELEDIIIRSNLDPFNTNFADNLGLYVPTPQDGNDYVNSMTFDELFSDLAA